jgi:transcription elongation factor GreA
MDTEYISADKKKALEEELVFLKGDKRKEILAALEYAKSLGDLSENAEYHQAREDQGKLEDRIQKIEHIVKSSIVVSEHSTNVVTIGCTVVAKKENTGETKTFKIVGAEEADMAAGKISNKSPLGVALYGKRKGETAKVSTPNGEITYEILEIK